MNITYQEFKPSLQLTPYVECYWLHSFDGDTQEESPVQRCLPLGMLEVIIHLDENIADIFINGDWKPLPRYMFHGIYNNPVHWKISGTARLFGIRFKPEKFRELFDVTAASLFCNFIDLGTFLGDEINILPESVKGLEEIEDIVVQANLILSQRITSPGALSSYVAEAAQLIRSTMGNITVEDVSDTIGVSMRQLQRRFKENTGVGPKSYIRIIRFRNALTSLRNTGQHTGFCDLTYSLGYADQAHLIREFKEFAGEAPNRIVKNADCYHKKPFELTDTNYEPTR